MSIVSDIQALQAAVTALQAAPAPTSTVDLAPVYQAIDALTKLAQDRVDVTPLQDRLAKLASRINKLENTIGI